MIVIERKGKTIVITGWRAWVIAAPFGPLGILRAAAAEVALGEPSESS